MKSEGEETCVDSEDVNYYSCDEDPTVVWKKRKFGNEGQSKGSGRKNSVQNSRAAVPLYALRSRERSGKI